MDGIRDNQMFAEQNKSLMTGPKRNLFKEYIQDLNLDEVNIVLFFFLFFNI